MNNVVRILMNRDGMSESEANELLSNVRQEIDVALQDNDYSLVEVIIYSDLGLELDYLIDIICY